MRTIVYTLLSLLLLIGCGEAQPPQTPEFPPPDRPVADIVSDQYASEDVRERRGEAEAIFDLLDIRPGMVVADVGAGRGYHTVRLSPKVGPQGRVIATDLYQSVLDRLKARADAEGLTNITYLRGAPDDPRLAPGSVDIVLMGRMYHEIAQPYAFTWRLRDALKPGGRVAIFEGDRPTNRHGTPPALLRCEMAATGWRQVAFHELEGIDPDGYLAVFAPAERRPEPEAIRPCAGKSRRGR